MHFKIERLVFFRMEWYHSHITLAAEGENGRNTDVNVNCTLCPCADKGGWENGGLGEWEAGGGSGIDEKIMLMYLMCELSIEC